ncbi:hypothetical protein ACFWNE_07710 [Streptomyces goshikiensis]|uniref:hypothetical protein n=1 Tax=Streptomyces goshikiensis TaxID=1942 RepID=UPI0036600C61
MNEQSRKRKQRALNLQRGIPNRVPATEAAHHIATLRSTMSWAELATAAGTSACHLRRIAGGLEPRINRGTHDKILALTAQPLGWRFVPALGSRRRIHALQAVGHSQCAIAEAAHTVQNRIHMVSAGKVQQVRLHFADRIIAAYRALADSEGTSTRGRTTAARNGWAGPAYWDDEDFDNPDFVPAVDDGSARVLASARRVDIAHLASFGIPDHDIAARLGISDSTVQQQIRDMRKAA